MYNDNYHVNTTEYLKRKKVFEERVHAMIGYVTKTSGCRSQHIAAYFTDVKINACGICDNCINEKVDYISIDEFKSISGQIANIVKDSPIPITDILNSLKSLKKEKVWQVINYMLAENKIYSDKDGKLGITTKTIGL